MTATASGTQILSTALHPVRHWLGVVAIYLGLFNGVALAFANCWSMEIFLSIGESQTDSFDMALKANRPPSREFICFKFGQTC
jgi:hypothetical protein